MVSSRFPPEIVRLVQHARDLVVTPSGWKAGEKSRRIEILLKAIQSHHHIVIYWDPVTIPEADAPDIDWALTLYAACCRIEALDSVSRYDCVMSLAMKTALVCAAFIRSAYYEAIPAKGYCAETPNPSERRASSEHRDGKVPTGGDPPT